MDTQFVYPPAHAGEQEIFLLTGKGPSSYNPATGDIIRNPGTGENIEFPMDCTTKSGNYSLTAFPSAAGIGILRPIWTWLWKFSGKQGVTGVTASGGTGMTPGTYALNFSGGGGTGAAGTITVLTATTTSQPVITNSGGGFTSAPTVTAATGGTPPTLTATVAAASGAVPNGTNLSSEVVQFGAIGGQL